MQFLHAKKSHVNIQNMQNVSPNLKVLDKILKIYMEAFEYAVKNNHPLNGQAFRNSNSSSKIDNQYQDFYERIKNEIYDILNLPSSAINNFVILKDTVISYLTFNFNRELLLKKYNLDEQQYKEYIKSKEILDNDRVFYIWFLEQYAQQRKSQVAGRRTTRPSRPSRTNKIQLKSTGQQYVVHTKGNKERFIKQSGREVLLKNIRGQYNIVK